MDDIQNILKNLYENSDLLREAILPYDDILLSVGFKTVAEQGVSERIKAAQLIVNIKNVDKVKRGNNES